MAIKTLSDALRDGSLTPQACDRCGGEGEPVLRQHKVVGWRCYPCRRLPTGKYYVYVIELTRRAGERAVYVGQSALFPAERFSQHLTGYKAAAIVRRFGLRLRPELFRHLNPLKNRAASEDMEQRLAARLSAAGFHVFGGH
jgi:hypothetical protein